MRTDVMAGLLLRSLKVVYLGLAKQNVETVVLLIFQENILKIERKLF